MNHAEVTGRPTFVFGRKNKVEMMQEAVEIHTYRERKSNTKFGTRIAMRDSQRLCMSKKDNSEEECKNT